MSAWAKRWALINVTRRTSEDTDEMYNFLSRKFYCSRCGRDDLPLALFFEHDKSCSFESAINRSSLDMLDEIRENLDTIEQRDERIEKLETACRDGLTVIQWFEGWLNGRATPVQYDDTKCKECGSLRKGHPSTHAYDPDSYSVLYAACDVSRMKNSIAKALGPKAIGHHMAKYEVLFAPKDVRCTSCKGLFAKQHMTEKDNSSDIDVCKWCKPRFQP